MRSPIAGFKGIGGQRHFLPRLISFPYQGMVEETGEEDAMGKAAKQSDLVSYSSKPG
jgi:hypothetical protein